MTQIVVRAYPTHVVVICDQLLTWPDGSIYSDDATKMVLFEGALLLAYTGLARVGTQDTGEWIAEAMAEHTVAWKALPALADKLNARWRYLGVPNNRLTIMGAGAAYFDDGPSTYLAVVSNYELEREEGDRSFLWKCIKAPRRDEVLTLIGGRPMPREAELLRSMRRADAHVTPGGMSELIADAIREQRDPFVGRDFLTAAGSKERLLEGSTVVLSGGSLKDHHIAGFLAEDGRPEWRTPWIVNGGSVIIGGGGSIPPG